MTMGERNGKSAFKGLALGFVSTCLWGAFYPVSRALFGFDDSNLEPVNFTVIRFALAFLFLSPVFLPGRSRLLLGRMLRERWRDLLLLGVFGIIGESLLVFCSLKYTTSARASLMANTSPIFTLLISRLAGRERLTMHKIVGIAVGFAGVAMVFAVNGQDVFMEGGSTALGDLLALGSGICWSYYTVFGDGLSNEYGGVLTCEVLFFVALAFMAPVSIFINHGIVLAMPWQAWVGAVYLGVFSYGVANALWYVALKHVSPGRLGSLGYASAAIATVLSMVFLGERFRLVHIVAIALVAVGIGVIVYPHEGRSGGKKLRA